MTTTTTAELARRYLHALATQTETDARLADAQARHLSASTQVTEAYQAFAAAALPDGVPIDVALAHAIIALAQLQEHTHDRDRI